MATISDDDNEPMSSTGNQSQQEPTDSAGQSADNSPSTHGSTGEGSGSAMARMISQEQSRVVPGVVEDAANDPA